MNEVMEYNSVIRHGSRLWMVLEGMERYTASKKDKFTPAQNAPFFLSGEQRENPLQVLSEFFQHRHLAEHRKVLWEILCAAITSQHADSYSSRETGGWVMYFRLLEELIEAAWLLDKNNTV